jgi:hypothetical protein
MSDTVTVSRADLAALFQGFDAGVFVRGIDRDHEPGWAARCVKPIAALAGLYRALHADPVAPESLPGGDADEVSHAHKSLTHALPVAPPSLGNGGTGVASPGSAGLDPNADPRSPEALRDSFEGRR